MSGREEQIVIEREGARLFGVVHHPLAGPARGIVVFCHPIFEEKKSAHRVLVEAARAFAAVGIGVLRFDYTGCGDSSGTFEDAGVPSWLADIRAAISAAVMRMPGCPVGLLGLRLGGALGAMTAEEDPKIRCLVLWEPVLDGRSYLMLDLRKKLVKEMVAHGRARESRGALLEQLDRNARIDVDGYAVTARLYEELSAIALGGQTRRFRGALLIVQVSPAAALNAPLRRFAEAVPTARVETVAVRDPPFWNAIGVAQCPGLIEQTSRWLERSFARA